MNPYLLARSLLFRLPPETAHTLSLNLLHTGVRGPVAGLLRACVPDQPVHLMGLTFRNRIGLAAGLDKNGEHIKTWAALGFGFVEVGTVTPQPQAGNDKPRLFRLPEHEAIINRMGFNNKGIDHLIEQVQRQRCNTVIGINIGKNKATPNERAVDDYLIGLRKAYPYADYIAINISSPNTPGLRDLQTGDELSRLLEGLKNEQTRLSDEYRRQVPLALKIAPDLDQTAMDAIAANLLQFHIDALIVSNTTLSRSGVETARHAGESGGLSGKPLMSLSTRVLKEMHQRLGERLPLIGVGGICNAADALAKLDAGASLVQIYSGFIYHGPRLIRDIARAFVEREKVKTANPHE